MLEYSMEEWIGPWIKKAARNMTTIHDHKLSRYGLTTAQVSVLSQLWLEDGQSQKDLVQKLGVRPASLTGVVDGLVAKGWAQRKETDEDARIKRLFLTPAGKELEEVSLSVGLQMEDLLRNGLSDEEQMIFLTLLKKVYRNVDQI